METRGIEDSPVRRINRRGWVGSGRLCAGPLRGGKSAGRAAGTAIVLMVAEARKGSVCGGAQARAGEARGWPEMGVDRAGCGIICR